MTTTAGAGFAAPNTTNPNKPGTATSPVVPTPVECVTAPDVAALAARFGEWAGSIHTLYPYRGEIYYGYGDYGANTGSASTPYGTNISSFNPTTGAFTTHLEGFKAEEVNTFRTIEGALYTPNIDPSVGADWTNSFASNRDGAWAENDGAGGAAHLFDVAGANGDLLVAGAHESWHGDVDNYRASVWLSTDDGHTWTESMSDTPANPADRDWYERYYWMGTIGDNVYTRASMNAPLAERPMRVFNTRTDTWLTVPDKGTGQAFGNNIYRANQVVPWGGRLWSVDYANLLSFDGANTVPVMISGTRGSPMTQTISVGDNNVLYAYSPNGQVYRVEVPTKGKQGPTLVPVVKVAANAESFTVAANKVWVSAGSGTGEVCAYPLP